MPKLGPLFGVVGLLSMLGCLCGDLPEATPAARFRTDDSSADDRCSGLFDYCVTVYCTVSNVGTAAGVGVIDYQFARDDGQTVHATESIELAPGETKIVPHNFTEAKLMGNAKFKCAIAAAPVSGAGR